MKRKTLSVEKRQTRAGWLFALPWLIGLVYFFIIPFAQSVWYSFNDVKISEQGGLVYSFLGLENFKYMLLKESTFNQSLVSAVTDLLYTVPVVLIFSVFIAILLNQKFKGRMIMRGMFFLPVIIASGVVIEIIQGDVFSATASSSETQAIFQTGAIEEAMSRVGLPPQIVEIITGVTSGIFDLSWKSGIQILLFISALQGIPVSYYEAASIEGANAWESFWKITFPVLSPTLFLAAIYTIIDSFVDVSNPVMKRILERFDALYYGMASASAVIYFIIIMLVVGLVALIFSKHLFHNS